ncbi:GPI transamidase component PIG-T, partial [Trema orientale]
SAQLSWRAQSSPSSSTSYNTTRRAPNSSQLIKNGRFSYQTDSFPVSFILLSILLWQCRPRIRGHRGRRIHGGVAAETFARSKGACPLPLREQSSTNRLQWPPPPCFPQSHLSAGGLMALFVPDEANIIGERVLGGWKGIFWSVEMSSAGLDGKGS